MSNSRTPLIRAHLQESGLTLAELLGGLALLSVILLSSFPFRAILHQKNQLQIRLDEIKNIVRYSKLRAISEKKPLILAPLPGGKDWSRGIILFVDDGGHEYNAQVKVIHQWSFDAKKSSIRWHGFQSSEYLLFSNRLKQSAMNGCFLIEHQKKQARLILNRMGRIQEKWV